jgi:enoyl-CoA hydratase/carnithine racemase
LLPRLAGYQCAAEKLLLGEPFDVNEAFRMGLVNRILPAAELDAFAEKQALKLASLPASSIRATKSLMKQFDAKTVAEQMRIEFNHFVKMLGSPDARKAMNAFFEKNK